VASLAERGFLYAALPGEDPQIYSSEGEVMATTKDGVKYVLRFGDLAGVETPAEKTEDKPADPNNPEEPKSSGPSRYLFVTATFDESVIPKPEMTPIPGEETPAAKPEGETPAEGEQPAEEPAAEEKPEEAPATEAPPAEPAADAPAEEKVPETKTVAQEGQPETKEAAPAETPAAEAPAAEAKPAEGEAKPAAAAPPTEEEQKKIEIRQENKRKQDEYDAAVKRGQDKVKELNERFADWYFIISDDVYKKIHLTRADIIKKKTIESTDELGNLKELQKGLGKPPAQPQFP
jgi:hypothetical protein